MLNLTVLVAKCLPALPEMPVATADAPAGHAPAPAPSLATLRQGADWKKTAMRQTARRGYVNSRR